MLSNKNFLDPWLHRGRTTGGLEPLARAAAPDPRLSKSLRAVRPAVYIPNYNGSRRLSAALESLREPDRRDRHRRRRQRLRRRLGRADPRGLPGGDAARDGHNLGFGPALNRAVREHPADPLILLNNDAVRAALRRGAARRPCHGRRVGGRGAAQERAPELIDSAGVVADRTLMGFDYLHGEPLAARRRRGRSARADRRRGALLARRLRGGRRLRRAHLPLLRGPRPGAAHGRRRRPLPARPEARALHAYSASLGAGSGRKYAFTGWSRGYMLRRYGVMAAAATRRCGRSPARAQSAPASSCSTGPAAALPAGSGLARRRRPRPPRGRRRSAARIGREALGRCAAGATGGPQSGGASRGRGARCGALGLYRRATSRARRRERPRAEVRRRERG